MSLVSISRRSNTFGELTGNIQQSTGNTDVVFDPCELLPAVAGDWPVEAGGEAAVDSDDLAAHESGCF